MTCAGAGRSGLPIPRSMMSAPALRAAALARLTCSNTYGGRRRMLWNSSMASMLLSPAQEPVGANSAFYHVWCRQGEVVQCAKKGAPDGASLHYCLASLLDPCLAPSLSFFFGFA